MLQHLANVLSYTSTEVMNLTLLMSSSELEDGGLSSHIDGIYYNIRKDLLQMAIYSVPIRAFFSSLIQ